MDNSRTDRRTIIGAGALAAIGAGALATQASAKDTTSSGWTPTAEPQDAWLDVAGARHRMAFDTTSAKAAAAAMNFAANYYEANESGYGIEPHDLAVVLILRALSTPFGFNDSIWAKYHDVFIEFLKLEGDQAERAKTTNPLFTGGAPEFAGEPSRTLSMLQQKGAMFAVCGMATKGISGMLAHRTGKPSSEIEADFRANLIPGARIVPAGIVAVDRVQEHGYAISYVA